MNNYKMLFQFALALALGIMGTYGAVAVFVYLAMGGEWLNAVVCGVGLMLAAYIGIDALCYGHAMDEEQSE